MTEIVPPHLRSEINPIFAHINWNIFKNDGSTIIAVCGGLGTGKSDTCLYGADSNEYHQTTENKYGFSPRFDLKRCHHFVKDFIEDITKMKDGNKQFYPKGTNFIFDEANIEASNLSWQDMKSKAIVTALQTNRKYNYVYWLTAPDFDSVVIGVRRLVNCYIEMQNVKKIISGKHYALAKVSWIDKNYYSGDTYRKQHRYWKPINLGIDKNGERVSIWRKFKVVKVWIPLVRKSLEEPYNEKKDAAMREWYTKMNSDLEYMKKYIGANGKEMKRYTSLELQKLFQNDKGEVVFDNILDIDGKVFEPSVEKKLIGSGFDNVTYKDCRSLMRWLRNERRLCVRNKSIDMSQTETPLLHNRKKKE